MTSYNEFLYGKNWKTRTDIPFETDGKTTYPNPNYKPETDKYSEHYLGPLTQQDVTKGDSQEEETMNVETNTGVDTPTFKPVPVTNADMAKAANEGLTQEEFAAILATKPLDGEITYDDAVVYVTDLDETADESTPTIH